MRKITKESSEAFVNFDQYKKSNTEVVSLDLISRFYLHDNCIAEIARSYDQSKSVKIDLCGWHTPTTRERINGILDALYYDFKIAQRNHEQVLVRGERIIKLSDDSFDPRFALKVFTSREFVSGTDLNAIADF